MRHGYYFLLLLLQNQSYTFSILFESFMKVNTMPLHTRTSTPTNQYDAKMEMLMQENDRLRKQLQALMSFRNHDDIENVFRNKLENVRSSSRSIKKGDTKSVLSPRPTQPLEKTTEETGRHIEKQSENKCNSYLKNKNYIDSQASIKQNMERTINEQLKLINKQKVQKSTMKATPANAQYLQSRTKITPIKTAPKQQKVIKVTKQQSRKMVECFQPVYAVRTKRRAIYEKQLQLNISKSLQKLQCGQPQAIRPPKKLRNTIYTQQ